MAALTPRPLAELDTAGIRGVFTDIDDTLTRDGQLFAQTYAALWDLQAAGITVVPVTGRSAGWAHMVLKTWPVAAVIAESGGLYLARQPASNPARMVTVLHDDPVRVRDDRTRLAACGARVMRDIPGLAPASDNSYRLVDYALDYCEEVARVPPELVARAIGTFVAAGFSARASSVHINAWRGDFDKGPMALRLIRDRYAGTRLAHIDAWAFVGDAPNDVSMFSLFPVSVGVANIIPLLDGLSHKPGYLTPSSYGEGFVEFARHLLARR